jgi:hypothetical protein
MILNKKQMKYMSLEKMIQKVQLLHKLTNMLMSHTTQICCNQLYSSCVFKEE